MPNQFSASSNNDRSKLPEIFIAFGKLGLISFGGPIAHLGYFHSEFVQKRKWITESQYADLVALCQFLPGPASSQVVFALGLLRGGILGGLIASLCFTLPSAMLMIGFAYGVSRFDDLSTAGWLHGLKLAAVAVVAQAVWGMGKNLCPDRIRVTICILVAAIVLIYPGAIVQIGVIAAGGLLGYFLYRHLPASDFDSISQPTKVSRRIAIISLLIFFLLLAALPFIASSTSSRYIDYFDSFYRSGSLVFGGGHVVLPLLREEIVPKGWLTDDLFLAGYGAAQAVPGPLFTFSAYLGAAMQPGRWSWLCGLWCLLAIFLPAWLLISGALPFWQTIRHQPWAKASLLGANAAVVGVLLAALYHPVSTEAIHNTHDMAAAIVGFLLLQHWKFPSWVIVGLFVCYGFWM